jgi:hypothetical protein
MDVIGYWFPYVFVVAGLGTCFYLFNRLREELRREAAPPPAPQNTRARLLEVRQGLLDLQEMLVEPPVPVVRPRPAAVHTLPRPQAAAGSRGFRTSP